MKQILLINGTYDQCNWGAQATACALRKSILSKNPNLHIRSFNYECMTHTYGITPKWLGSKIINNKNNLINLVATKMEQYPIDC